MYKSKLKRDKEETENPDERMIAINPCCPYNERIDLSANRGCAGGSNFRL